MFLELNKMKGPQNSETDDQDGPVRPIAYTQRTEETMDSDVQLSNNGAAYQPRQENASEPSLPNDPAVLDLYSVNDSVALRPHDEVNKVEAPLLAVEVKDARLSYGRGAKAFHALRGVNLRVPEGVIYGLLGPSGCGKTTLLCSVVGRRTLKQGEVRVFGTKPGSKDSCIPGRWVGFMPQELALYPEFTIEETLTYFGRLHRIDPETLKERTEFLLTFLDLPRKTRLVKNLSGGQQRRVSFASALIHRPPLLILDEPTVGVDPLLRQSIWNHLVKLTSLEGMTVIITTHYIEEARQANMVGLMRKGRLLAEASPDALINMFQEPTLEDCFLKLCLLDKDKEDSDATDELNNVAVENAGIQPPGAEILPFEAPEAKDKALYIISNAIPKPVEAANPPSYDMSASTLDLISRNSINDLQMRQKERLRVKKDSLIPDKVRMPRKTNPMMDSLVKTYALTSKNMTRLRRNLTVVLFQFALPAIQVILLCLCIGRPPFDLPLAVVNHEMTTGVSTMFLQKLDNHTITQKHFTDLESAIQSVRDGLTWGALEIGQNFTNDLYQRFSLGLSADNATIEGSSIKVYLDMTNQQIGLTLQASLLESFQDFAREVLVIYGASPALAELPVVMETPIYGSIKPSFTEFVAPGVILSITYIMAVGLTALSFVEERKSGLFDRSWVSGVTSIQTLISHIITQSVVLIFQVFGLLVFTFLVFDIPSRGPFILVILMTLLQGAVGMAYGLVISALVTEENTAIMIALGSFYPNLILSGIVWPIEGMPHFVRFFSYCLPQTLATESTRAILSRGWDLTYSVVWSGFLVTFAWLAFFLIAAAAIFRLRK